MAEANEKVVALMSLVNEEVGEPEDMMVALPPDDEDDISAISYILLGELNRREEGVRQIDYVEKIIPRYPDKQFKRHFRFHKESVEILCQEIAPCSVMQQNNPGGRPMISIFKQVLMFLWYLAGKEAFYKIADKFNVTESAVRRTIKRVAEAILEKKLDLISWPTGQKVTENINGFKAMKGMDGAIGAIDGTHFQVLGLLHKVNYINRKNFPSIQMQSVCDHNMLFMDCFVGWPGSVHDARVFSNSDLCKRINEDQATMFPGDTYILGDAAYKLETYMMTPYKNVDSLDTHQTAYNYNYKHSATRMVIERAFGHLKSRFPRLRLIESRDTDFICKLIMSACCLHNFCILEDRRLGVEGEILFDIEDEEEINHYICYGSSSRDAERKRSRIAKNL